MNQYLSLAVGMVVGLVLVWGKLYTLAGFSSIAMAALSVIEHALVLGLQRRVTEEVHGRLSL